ncbi:hypothetical protein ACFVT5_06110 [Streptomyces sp. NPDC058001]|uniref:hypothetical protein n=1 Tax=Streptomyces sp. NPDC058001 TaxID=3346300 RepID=UPI0036ED7D3A
MDPESADRSALVDRQWAGDLRAAVFCALALLCLVTLIDCANRTFTPLRGALWTGLSLLLYAVLHPPKVTAGPGRLAVHGTWRTQQVATDLLISVHRADGVAPRLVLRDALGNRVTMDPTVFTTNPLLWHEVETGARAARAAGLLRTGTAVVDALADRVDQDTARGVFEASGIT